MGGTSRRSSEEGVNGVKFLVLCGTTLIAGVSAMDVDINVESGLAGTVEAGPSIKPFFVILLVLLLVVDRSVLNPGVGIANPSLSIIGVSCFVSTCSSFVSIVGVAANGEWVTEIKVEVASGVLTPCNTFCQSDDGVLSGLRLHAAEEGGGVVVSESSSRRRFFLFGEGMYLFNIWFTYIYMDILPDAIIRHISGYLWVKEVLNLEVGIQRPYVNRKETLINKYNREPKHKEVTIFKKRRNVKYILDSYYEEDLLYTKVTSFYGHHKIISIISHEICKGTVEANRWTLRAFTLKTASFQQLARRQRIPMLLQLHFQ